MKSNAVCDSTRDGFALNGAKVSVLYAVCILHKVQNCLLRNDMYEIQMWIMDYQWNTDGKRDW
jgi:hypothetical protein